MSKKFKSRIKNFKHMKMKVKIFDEFGKKIFVSEGNPKQCHKETTHFLRYGIQVIEASDFWRMFDFLGLQEDFDNIKKRRGSVERV